MSGLFLPTLSHFLNDNGWLASEGRLRYRIVPTLGGEGGDILTAEIWEGPWAYEFSTVEDTRTFPLSSEGLEELGQWLMDRAREVNARPPRSLEENVSRRTGSP